MNLWKVGGLKCKNGYFGWDKGVYVKFQGLDLIWEKLRGLNINLGFKEFSRFLFYSKQVWNMSTTPMDRGGGLVYGSTVHTGGGAGRGSSKSRILAAQAGRRACGSEWRGWATRPEVGAVEGSDLAVRLAEEVRMHVSRLCGALARTRRGCGGEVAKGEGRIGWRSAARQREERKGEGGRLALAW